MTLRESAAADRPFDLLALGDPVLDVVVHSAGLPAWDDKHLGTQARLLAGGSEANAACAASRLGLRTALIGAVGQGQAAFHRQALARCGVAHQHLHEREDQLCATAVVYVSPAGERAVSYVPAAAWAGRADALAPLLPQARWLYHLPYDLAFFERAAQAARAAGVQVAVDIERAVAAQPDAMAVLGAHCDLLFFNEAGFQAATGQAATVANAAAWIAKTMAQTLVVSLGPRGALAVGSDGAAAVQAAYQARVVDTTGAGDCFNGAFLAARVQGCDLQAALRQACAAACLCVEAQGARGGLPTPAALVQVMQRRRLVDHAAARPDRLLHPLGP